MPPNLGNILLGTALAFAAASPAAAPAEPSAVHSEAEAEIAGHVTTYLRSVDLADAQLAGGIWSTSPRVTFIHPRGHEHGWREVERNIYGFFGSTFSKRSLKRVGDLHVQIYGDVAVVEFDWDFVATFRKNGKGIHTTGRESQVHLNLPGQGWRIVQVHYSGPPVTAAGQGF